MSTSGQTPGCHRRRRRWPPVTPDDERGSFMPAYAALIVGVLLGGMVLYQIADAANLSARAQSAADAAALAGAKELKSQLQDLVLTTGLNEVIAVDQDLDLGLVCGEAEAYAHANDAELTACEVEVDPALEGSEVFVEVISLDEVDEESGLSDQVRTRLTRQARAAFEVSFAGGPDGATPGAPVPSAGGGPCSIPEDELEAVADDVEGIDEVSDESALCSYHGDGFSSQPSVSGLTPEMRVSVVRLEQALGHPVAINSGYRHPAYQAQLCQTVAGPCAAPGQSMHNYGLAIDVANHGQVAAAVDADPDIGLCQPLPANDAVHFSHVTGSECGGQTGTFGDGGIFGGKPGSFVTFDDVHLVD